VWQSRGLLTGAGGSDPFFTGAQARSAFDQVGGTGYSLGGKVPVENTGGAGTRDGHWRESVFDNEVCTGFIDAGANPLSIVTAAQFIDLTYQVNLGDADPYTLPGPLSARAASGVQVHLVNDIYRGPIMMIDGAGRITSIVQPRQ